MAEARRKPSPVNPKLWMEMGELLAKDSPGDQSAWKEVQGAGVAGSSSCRETWDRNNEKSRQPLSHPLG